MNTPGFFLTFHRIFHRRNFTHAVLAVLALVVLPHAFAQNINWVGGTSANWSIASNWSPNAFPSNSSNVTIDTNSGNQPVISQGFWILNSLTVGNTSTSGANTLLTIQGGAGVQVSAFIFRHILIGNGSGSTGAVLVTDPGSLLQANPSTTSNLGSAFVVGQGSYGSLTIANGATVVGMFALGGSASGNGSVLVTGAGSKWLPGEYIFDGMINGSIGAVTIANGANLTTTGGGFIGASANSTGSVTITDTGSAWNAAGDISVGNATNSSGSLTLANGGAINVSNGNILLGLRGNGILNLNEGSFFQDGNANGSLVFNNSGNATINWNGGTMQATKNLTLEANMTMTGNGCIFDTNGFDCTFQDNLSGSGNLTKNGNGNLTITAYANAQNSTAFYTGNTFINAGAVTIYEQAIQRGFAVNVSSNITDNATLIFGSTFGSATYSGVLSGNGILRINGPLTMTGNNTFTGNIQANFGIFGPFNSLVFTGDTSQMGGNITGGANVTFAQSFDTSYAGNLVNVSINISGSGNLTLSGNNYGLFEVFLNSGNLIFTGNTAQSQVIYSRAGTNIFFNQNFDSSINQLEGYCNVIKEGAGDLTMKLSTYSGTTNISTGTLTFNGISFGDPASSIVNNAALVFSGPYTSYCFATISGNGTVVINGASDVWLGGSNTYTGTTTINGDLLLVNGQLAAASNVTVNSGGTLGGTGSVLGPITVNAGGNLAPGASFGTLTINTISLDPAATTSFSIADSGNYSSLSITGALAETGNLVLNLSSNLHVGTYQLISSTGGLSNDFSNVSLAGLYAAALTDSSGIWSANISGANFTFNASTGQLVVTTTLLPAGISAAKATWLQKYFSIPQLADNTVSGDGATPNGDAFPNLLKYAFNLGPWDDGYTVLPQPAITNGNLVLTFIEYQTDVTYTVEASTDLTNWSTTGVVIQTNGNQVTATYPLPVSGTAFLHVVVAPVH